MKITKFNNASNYYQKVESYLLQDEATNCLILGFSKALGNSPKNNDNFPYLVTVENQGKIIATAIQASSHRRLILSKCLDVEALNLIVQDLKLPNHSLPGVIGLKSEAQTFANTWQLLTGESFQLAVAMKIHQLKVVQAINQASGSLRLATKSDRSLLINWIQAFESEALGENEPKSDSQLWFDKNLEQGSLYVWQDRVSVSMVAFGGATPNGIRISAVYTPPEHRNKGYATSSVAALSQRLLAQGYKYCFLFTDLANPTSNYIYQKIGYQSVCEMSNYVFKS